MSNVPGQRSAQPVRRASVAVQRALGRAVRDAGGLCEQVGVTDLDTGARAVLTVDGQGREIWTDDVTGAVAPVRVDESR